MLRCLVLPSPESAPNLRLLSSGAGVKWLPTAVYSCARCCSPRGLDDRCEPIRFPPLPSPDFHYPRLALIWVSLASLVILSFGWLINRDGACLDRTGERMNFKSPLDPSFTHTHRHSYTYEFNELFYWPLEVCLSDRQSLFCLAFSHTANRW